MRGNRLNRDAAHRRAMLRNMVTSLFARERIKTTVPKAKQARRYAERMITFAKRGDLHARRMAARFVNDPQVLQKLFTEIAPRYEERPGGYTRVIKAGVRKGDDAQMAILELVGSEYKPKPKPKHKKKHTEEAAPKDKAKAKPKAAPTAVATAEDASEAPAEDAGDTPEATKE
ncbi:MAG: 50S ribosomal protein L17 [Candidatus Krumholzibacteriota bacterium]|nr:50S ribosomal protein L17 [Candidatus Krumholzibacteriota bacterium]